MPRQSPRLRARRLLRRRRRAAAGHLGRPVRGLKYCTSCVPWFGSARALNRQDRLGESTPKCARALPTRTRKSSRPLLPAELRLQPPRPCHLLRLPQPAPSPQRPSYGARREHRRRRRAARGGSVPREQHGQGVPRHLPSRLGTSPPPPRDLSTVEQHARLFPGTAGAGPVKLLVVAIAFANGRISRAPSSPTALRYHR